MLKYYDQYDDYVNIAGALTKCWQRGGWLVMPKHSDINAHVSSLLGNSNAWIGLGDFGVEGAYEFIDGSRMQWLNWDGGQPNNAHGNEDCVQIHENGRWHDYPCDASEGYVCQIPNSRSLPYDHSHFTVYKNTDRTTYEDAVAVCGQFSSRLVKVTNSRYAKRLIEKFPQLALSSFWVGKDGNRNQCPVIMSDGESENDCYETKPFICEAVEPHKVVVSDQAPKVAESSDLEIQCSAYGFPTPDVIWFRNDMEIKGQVKRKGHSTMKLNDVTSADYGEYVCRATNIIRSKVYEMEGYSFVHVIDEAE